MTSRTFAIYARHRNSSSVDEQIRRCREFAAAHGFEAGEVAVFNDSAAAANEQSTPEGFKALLAAVEAREFEVLLVEDFYRLSPCARTYFKLVAMLSDAGVRVMTPHGADSASNYWEQLRRLIADEAARLRGERIRRGMAYQLERGHMVSAIAFGYRAERAVLQGGRDVGTVWTVCEAEAVLIREMYARREAGESLRNLAGWLNEAGISPPGGGRGWYASTVARILSNPIYRGWFYPGRHLAKVAMNSLDQASLHWSGFAREALRIVGDVQWFAVQEPNAVVGSDETRD